MPFHNRNLIMISSLFRVFFYNKLAPIAEIKSPHIDNL